MGFVDTLEDRLHSCPNHQAKSDLEIVLEKVYELRREWKYDFYGIYKDSALEGNDDARKIEFVKALGEVFAWTTEYFRGFTSTSISSTLDWSESRNGRTKYVDLVAGYCTMVWHKSAFMSSYGSYHSNEESIPLSEDRRRLHKSIISEHHLVPTKQENGHEDSQISMPAQYQLARQYAAHVNHEKYGIVHSLRLRDIEWHEDYIEAAWWAMILRGIVWDMSTTGDIPYRQKPYHWKTHCVPSAFYDIRTPVWIT